MQSKLKCLFHAQTSVTFAEQHQCCDVYLSTEDGSGSSSSWFTGLYMKKKKGKGGEMARKQEKDGKGTGNTRYMAIYGVFRSPTGV